MKCPFRAGHASPILIALGLQFVAACSPPATDHYAERAARFAPQTSAETVELIPSPDTQDAVWARSREADRLIFGNPGQTPFIALACERDGVTSKLRLTRFARAPQGGEALIAMIGNGHIARWPMDATRAGNADVWQGDIALDNAKIEVLAGGRSVEATLPGTGTVKLNASPLPRELIQRCERFNSPELLDEHQMPSPAR